MRNIGEKLKIEIETMLSTIIKESKDFDRVVEESATAFLLIGFCSLITDFLVSTTFFIL